MEKPMLAASGQRFGALRFARIFLSSLLAGFQTLLSFWPSAVFVSLFDSKDIKEESNETKTRRKGLKTAKRPKPSPGGRTKGLAGLGPPLRKWTKDCRKE
jgi:hypothetical protein